MQILTLTQNGRNGTSPVYVVAGKIIKMLPRYTVLNQEPVISGTVICMSTGVSVEVTEHPSEILERIENAG